VTAAGLGAIETGQVTPREESFCDHTIRTPGPLVVADARTDSRFSTNPSVTGDPNIRFYAGQPLAAPTGERIGALCLVDDRPRRLTDDQIDLLRVLADWVERELAMQDELDQAAEIQAQLLPQAPPSTRGLQVAGVCQPARMIGGDFFDWFVLPDGRVQLIIADVMGKGLGTGIVAANVRAVLRVALRFNEPAEAVTRAAVGLEDDLERAGVFVTAFIARIVQRDWSVEYVDAGHGLALVVAPDGAMRRLQTGGLPLGALRGQQWTSRRTILHPGETLMTASDGYLDPFADRAALVAFAASANQAARTAQDLVDACAALASEFDAQDDMTFLAARRPA
jgi:serine phosphatase RsbU (regulator of sigma subunit)